MPNVCVVHLVWKPLGIETFERFLSSYKQNSGGLDHQLLVVFNGFGSRKELSSYFDLLSGTAHQDLILSRAVQDIPAYFAAARSVTTEFVCFLNSYSVLLDNDWLTKLYTHVRHENVGLVGATGSFQSLYNSVKDSMSTVPQRSVLRRLVGSIRRRWSLSRFKLYFDPFPNPHIRTNAFMLRRELMLGLDIGPMRTKMEAMSFESGKNSLTRQIQRANLKVLVVGRNGHAYEPDDWFASETYKSGTQANLLVADNRTEQYARADMASQKEMTRVAWGR